jgi:hypothetical protein
MNDDLKSCCVKPEYRHAPYRTSEWVVGWRKGSSVSLNFKQHLKLTIISIRLLQKTAKKCRKSQINLSNQNKYFIIRVIMRRICRKLREWKGGRKREEWKREEWKGAIKKPPGGGFSLASFCNSLLAGKRTLEMSEGATE